ncbi:MAG: hypothetical protein KY455_10185 [Euryarchaeota archaeon]|nr:hypothetical protein [Euryarchaeota archaeon]
MASGQLAGTVGLHVGKKPHQTRTLGRGESTIFDNDGGADPYYINGVGRPDDDGTPLEIGDGPHLLPGDNLYVSLKNNSTSDIVDSDDTSAVLYIPYAEYDAVTGAFIGTDVFDDVAQRNTTLSQGGLPDDPSADKNKETMVYAFGPTPAGVVRTLYGRVKINIRDDTL